MPDVREVFEKATKEFRLAPGAIERQHRNQRRRTVRRKVGGFVLAAVVIVGLVAAAANIASRHDRPTPLNHHTHHPSPSPSPSPIDAGSGVTGVPQRGVVVSLDAGKETVIPLLPPDAYGLSLSPDGTTIAFVTNHTGTLSSSRIATIGIDGTGLHVITDTPSTALMPDWSPDGSRIAFQADGDNGSVDIYTMNADGTDVQVVVSSPADDQEPQWSPDGSLLAYSSGGSGPTNDSEEIYTVAPSGGRPTRLTHNGVADFQPAWSPDGTQLAFVRESQGGGKQPFSHLWLMNADGTNQHRVTRTDAEGPQWSPDGTRIAAVSFTGRFREVQMDGGVNQEPVMRVEVVDVVTGASTPVGSVRVATFRNRPQWLPSGHALVVSRLGSSR